MAERRVRIDLYVGPKVDARPEAIPAMEASGEWVFEEKHDGFWCCAVVESGVIMQMVSRTGLPFEGADVAGLVDLHCAPGGSGRLVGELTADAVDGEKCGVRRLHLFEILDWNGIDLRDLSQTDRREALEMVVATIDPVLLPEPRILLVEQRTTGIADWYREILARGGEGLVAKRRDAVCRARCGDGKIESWIRIKPKNTVDFVVIGPGGLAPKGTPKIDLGLYKDTKDGQRLVKVMSPTWPAKIDGVATISHPSTGVPVADLKSGDIVEVEGAEIFPSGAVRHGHVKRVRTDKRDEDCVLEGS